MKHMLFFALLAASLTGRAQSQASFQIIDLSQTQIRLFNAYQHSDTLTRNTVFADSLYTPYQEFWSGYLGGKDSYLKWVNNNVLPQLAGYNKRNEQINGKELMIQFEEVKARMIQLTGKEPKGAWYVVYGPAWTDLGGLTGGTMLIDLSHGRNTSNEAILLSFPHEITHQIYSNVNTHQDTTALGTIIGEGFAVYMNQLYWGVKYGLPVHLGFTEKELAACMEEDESIRSFFQKHKYSSDRTVILQFRSRSEKLLPHLPGAIGYYIGYRIVEKYVRKHGPQSWKDVFTKSPREIYLASGY